MTTSIKVSAIRKAINEALEAIECKMTRGSFEFDKETGSVKFDAVPVAVKSDAKPQTVSTGDEAKDKFLANVTKNELDKMVRRWYERNLTDTSGNKWVITALANNGEKFTLSPKDGEGKNKRVDFTKVEATIAEGRGAKIELGTKPKVTPKTETTAPVADTEELETLLQTQPRELLLEIIEACIEADILDEDEKPSRTGVKTLSKFLLTATKLTGRKSLATYVKKFVKTASAPANPKTEPKETSNGLSSKTELELNVKYKNTFNKDKKAFAEELDIKLPAKVKFLAEFQTAKGSRYLIGFSMKDGKNNLRGFDPESGKIKLVPLKVAKFA